MKRFWTSLVTVSIIEWIGRNPVMAAGVLTLLGAGGGAVIANLTTPTLLPLASSYFNQNQNIGTTTNGLKPNGGTAGAMEFPADVTGSFGIYFEAKVDDALGYGTNYESPFNGALLSQNSAPGLPTFFYQKIYAGQGGTQWFNGPSGTFNGNAGATAGSNYNTGFYPFTATGGGCAREPSGVWQGGTTSVQITDPGFMCETTPTVNVASIPNAGAQQTGVTATCAASSVSGQMLVTTSLAVSPGLSPGMTYNLSGFTTSGGTGWGSGATITPTATSVTGSGPYSLVGTLAGTCPTISSTGNALSGTGASITLISPSTTNPFQYGQTGIATKNGQRICFILGEYGDNVTGPNALPGAQFLHMVDENGNALAGAPALVPWLNQGTANFTGYTLAGTQSSSSTAALQVTALNPYTITGASYSGTTGYVTFTTSTSPGFVQGSEFTVSGTTSTGASANLTYVAVTGTSGTTLVGNPLNGVAGTPQANNPGTISTPGGSQLVSNIVPGMRVLGATGSAVVSPYGTFGSTGTGALGTYGLTANQASFQFTATGTSGASQITLSGAPATTLVQGQAISGTGIASGTTIGTISSGSGGSGSVYNISAPLTGTLSGSNNVTAAGTIGSSGAPVSLYAYTAFYYNTVAVTSSAPYGSVSSLPRTNYGDFLAVFGANATQAPYGSFKSGWGGTIGNVAMLYGAFPQTTGGSPSTASLASLCKKTTDLNTFAAANGMTVNALYRLNDLGIFGDSSGADFTGYISGASGTSGGTATLNLTAAGSGATTVAAMPSNAIISGAGIPGCPSSCPKLTTPSSGLITFGSGITSANVASMGSPIALKAGAFAPMTPLQSNTVSGYIDNGSGSTPTLHVLSLPTSPANAAANFTASLGTQITASIASGTNQLVVTSPTNTGSNSAALGLGMTVNIPGGTPSTAHIQSLGTALGFNGTYTLDTTVTGASTAETMFGTCATPAPGCLPGSPTALFNVSVSSGSLTQGMVVTDGGASLTAQPLLITGGGGATWTVAGNYYPSILNDTTMVGSLSSVIPGEYLQNASIATPVKVLNYQPTCSSGGSISGAINGGLGCYTLSAYPGAIGSSGSPATFTGATISDGGAIAPGPALAIHDQGPGIIFPVGYPVACSALGSCSGTGSLYLTGTYDTSALGGAPSTIQAQVSLTAGGPPVPGCSACAWTNLMGYSATLSSGTVYNWAGSAIGIPANGAPLFVSVRAANGTAYATMPNSIRVGLPFEGYGQGQFEAFPAAQSGTNWSYFAGLWSTVSRHSPYTGNYSWFTGPAIAGAFVPGQSLSIAGDRFGITGNGQPLSEGLGTFEQLLTNAFGWPSSFNDMTHDGVGNLIMTLGNTAQTQTVGVGNGSQTAWCSASEFCGSANTSVAGPLYFNAGALTGATLGGASISSGGVLSVPASTGIVRGALSPGMVLSDTTGSIGSTPTLSYCLTGCTISAYTVGSFGAQTWATTYSGSGVSAETMRADPSPGPTPWPNANVQLNGLPINLLGYGAFLVKAGTFTLSVNGTVVCQDNQAFAYNNTGGNCTGAGIASSFVNYQTGDYQITFSTAPANNAVIVASWTNIISPIPVSSAQYSRPPGVDYFGDSSGPTSGSIVGLMNKTPGGLAGHINSGCSTDNGYIQASNAVNPGYQFGAPGYATETSWFYDTKFPNALPGFSATIPQIVLQSWRAEGAAMFNNPAFGQIDICDQWGQDFSTKSTFPGSISGGVLTLSGNATGPMWEGEVIGGAGLTSPTGIYITSLASGAWGASGSTYNLSGASGVTASGAMYNDVFYKGSGPAIYGGAINDINVQNQGLCSLCDNPHMANGPTGGRRVGARLAATAWGGLTNTSGAVFPPNASPPSLDRVKADAGGCDSSALASPCFDVSNTYQATASGSWTGNSFTTNGSGIAAHSRPFVVGQVVSCNTCAANMVITSVSNPPTQSTVSGQGQVGQSFSFKTNINATSPSSGTMTAGCNTAATGGSNCIDIAISINTTNGTFGTAAALATCGANNLNGSAPNYAPPNGLCQDNGVGEITRGFRIGTAQTMYMTPYPTGSVFDDGVDFIGGAFNQSAAFTCNIVAAKVVQCVIGPAYASGLPTGVGKWSSGSTFVNYGDMSVLSGRMQSVVGYVGGQSFPIASAGSSYTNGFYQGVIASCPTVASGDVLPRFDVTVSGGSIVSVVPSATGGGSQSTQPTGLGIGSPCTLTNTNFPSGMTSGGGSGGSITIQLAPPEGEGGVATFNTDQNTMGMFLYDNTGFVGNPLNMFFTNGQGGYFEPGLPLRPFGEFQGVAVSG